MRQSKTKPHFFRNDNKHHREILVHLKMYEDHNIERFQIIVDNYESLVKELNHELYKLKEEQEHLKSDLSVVIAENTQLSQKLQETLTLDRTKPNDEVLSADLLSNLKGQINTLITEKECVTKLWQEGIKSIDHLEDELKIYQAGTESFVPKKEHQKIKHLYEEKIHDLELKLTTSESKLANYIKQAESKIEIKHQEVDQSLENQASALKIVKNLESEVLRLQKRLQETVDEKVKLERSLENKEDIIQGLKKANSDCLVRVTEAVTIVEAALNEKDAALFREKEIREENEKLLKEMTEIVKECQEKIQKETIRLNAEYQEKRREFLEELSTAHKEIKNKTDEIEALNKKCSLLENDIEKMHQGHCKIDENEINRLLVLEKNLESTFQKLLLSEKQNIKLASEKESMKNDLDQMAGIYERNLKSKELEIATLQSKLNRQEFELKESYQEVNKITDKMSKLTQQISKTEIELQNQKENFETCMKSKYDEKFEELSKQYNSNMKELQLQMAKKNEINQQWRKESKIITENLERIVTTLRHEMQSLRKEKNILGENCRKAEEKVKQYKTFLELISKDVNKISSLTLGPNVS